MLWYKFYCKFFPVNKWQIIVWKIGSWKLEENSWIELNFNNLIFSFSMQQNLSAIKNIIQILRIINLWIYEFNRKVWILEKTNGKCNEWKISALFFYQRAKATQKQYENDKLYSIFPHNKLRFSFLEFALSFFWKLKIKINNLRNKK